jgi:alkylation response protein AidB-like acyl-CoA dehydrogenase
MGLPDQYSSAMALERRLGDPLDPQSEISFARAAQQDESEEYPAAACALLDRLGLHRHYVPVDCGGQLASFEELTALARVVARRDLTVAVAHGKTLLGALAVWLAGDEAQRRRVAAIVQAGGQVALALSERAHGADLLAGEAAAQPVPGGGARGEGGWLLSGEKWLINNATRGAALTVLARTSADGGPRGFSLFLVEKALLAPGSYTDLPKLKTLGLRGADISGIRFDGCHLPAGSLIGRLGGGLEVTMALLQVSRTFVAGLSLGAAETALRTVLAFALSRRLYGSVVFAIPHARRALVDGFVDLLLCDCLTVAAVRGLHAATEQASLFSAVVKYFVPTTLESAMRSLAVVLGARHYLREEHLWGVLQKTMRDGAIVSLFDGSTVVNLSGLALELRALARAAAAPATARGAARSAISADAALRARLEILFNLERPVPRFEPARLVLSSRGRDDLLRGLALIRPALRRSGEAEHADPRVVAAVAAAAERILRARRVQLRRLEELARSGVGPAFAMSPPAFELAASYCRLYAAAACIQMWQGSRHLLGEFFARGEWLVLALARLLPGRSAAPPDSCYDAVAAELVRRLEQRQLYSIVALPLAGAGPQ